MKKILIHCHVYYPELWQELKECIANISPYKFDLFVTLVEANQSLQEDIKISHPHSIIEIIENRGYDVGPFIYMLNKINLDNYSYVIKLHTKRNIKQYTYLNGFDVSCDKWRKELLSFMYIFHQSLAYFDNHTNVGMIGGENVILTQDEDREKDIHCKLIPIASNLGITISQYTFIAGTMFIVKANLLELLQHKFTLKDFERSGVSNNSLAHVLERLLGAIVYNQNYIISDALGNYSKNRIKRYYRHIAYNITSFLFRKKITQDGKVRIKICKIPIMKLDSKFFKF